MIQENFFFGKSLKEKGFKCFKNLIIDLKITDPVSGTVNWTDVKQFNLMFSWVGSTSNSKDLYLRPETAQGIFLNFLIL